MKGLFTIVLFFTSLVVAAQTAEEKLVTTIKEFHQALVKKNTVSIIQQTDKKVSYGHSNGWVETKAEMINNLETGYLTYRSFKEDSLQLTINGNVAHARFTADIEATLNQKDSQFHLKVLEVWVKKGKRWLLFARQAVKG